MAIGKGSWRGVGIRGVIESAGSMSGWIPFVFGWMVVLRRRVIASTLVSPARGFKLAAARKTSDLISAS